MRNGHAADAIENDPNFPLFVCISNSSRTHCVSSWRLVELYKCSAECVGRRRTWFAVDTVSNCASNVLNIQEWKITNCWKINSGLSAVELYEPGTMQWCNTLCTGTHNLSIAATAASNIDSYSFRYRHSPYMKINEPVVAAASARTPVCGSEMHIGMGIRPNSDGAACRTAVDSKNIQHFTVWCSLIFNWVSVKLQGGYSGLYRTHTRTQTDLYRKQINCIFPGRK